MTIRTFALAGAAALVLSVPAMAATHHRAVSSDPAADAAEARITAQLNQQQASKPGTAPSVTTTTAMTTGTSDNSAWASQQAGADNAQAPSPGGSSEPQAKGPNEEEKTITGTQSSQPADGTQAH